jgi:hypothetical protein
MHRILRSFLLILFVSSSLFAQSNEFQLQQGTVVKLVEGNRAKELIMTPDTYTSVFSKFDIKSKSENTDASTVDDYMKFASKQIVGWTADEKKSFKKIVESVSKKISKLGLKLKMPAEIEIIKTTMAEEGGADGYTRGAYICLGEKDVDGKYETLEKLFIHELFHVLSRFDNDMREKVYNVFGFKKCNEVSYPTEIAELRISNPDAPHNNFYITVESEGKPVDAMLILYADKPYDGGSFFTYLRLGMLAVEGDEMNKKPVYKDGKPLILELNNVKGFFKQVGKNTNYIIHAEEMSAEQFVMLLNETKDLPNPELIEAMKNAMK